MKHIKIVTAVIMIFHFSSATSEVSNSIQNSLMDLSGLSAITSIPKLETTKQRNQFFDNYSVLSIPDINIVDQVQLQNIQTFAPSHRQIGLDGLNKIKGITTGLTTQGVMVTPEDFKGIKIQNGKITVADMDSKSQGVKDIVGVANSALQEVKSLNQKELNSLKLTITDMKNMHRTQPHVEERTRRLPANGEVTHLNGDEDKLWLGAFPGSSNAFVMNGPDTITGKANGFLNVVPDLGSVATSFKGVNTSNPMFGRVNQTPELLTQTMSAINLGSINNGNSVASIGGGVSAFEYMNAFNDQGNAFIMKGPDTITGNTNGFQPLYSTNLSNLNGSSLFEYMPNATFATFASFKDKTFDFSLNSNPNSFLSITPRDAFDQFCTTGSLCRDKLSYGNLQGALDEIVKSIPEGVALR